MMRINLCQIFIIIIFFKTSSENNFCNSTQGEKNNVTWLRTTTRNISDPICIGLNKEFLYRECIEGEWGPEPECSSIQTPISSCPDGYTQFNRICFTITPPSNFPPTCPPGPRLEFKSYKYIIPEDILIWLPIQRDVRDGLGFMRWIEPSELYGSLFTDYTIDNNEADCIVYYDNNQRAVSCNSSFSGICAYETTLGWVENPLCGTSCVPSDFFELQKCTCVSNSPQVDYKKAEFLTRMQNIAYNQLTTGNCSIGLEKLQNGTYIWQNSQTQIDYTYWSPNVNFNYTYGASSLDGWILTPSPLSCTIYNKNLEFVEPSLELELDVNFLLLVRNVHMLKKINDISVFCFSNGAATSLIYRYSTLDKFYDIDNIIKVQFDTLNTLPGEYWCEAVTLDDRVIKSNVVVSDLELNFSEYVLIVKFKYEIEEEVDPLNQSLIDYLDQEFFYFFQHNEDLKNSYYPRIMKILDIDRNLGEVVINVHITAAQFSADELYNYNVVYPLINDVVLNTVGMSTIDFKSAFYCYAENNGNLSWPQLYVGRSTHPLEFCFSDDGLRVIRTCNGSFIDGAQWSKYKPCELFSRSVLSNQLLNLLDYNPDNLTANRVYKITLNSGNLNALDTYLVLENFKKIINANENFTILEPFIKTINNLLNIPDRNVLVQAQTKMRVTYGFLTLLKNISRTFLHSFDFALKYFIFKSFQTLELTGVLYFDNGTIKTSNENLSFENVAQMKNLKMVFAFNTKEHLKSFDRQSAFAVFLGQNFFIENESTFLNITPIFGTISSDNITTSVKIMYKMQFDEFVDSCMVWNYTSNQRGYWKKINSPQVLKNFAVCYFTISGYFALNIKPKEADITDSLIDILDSNATNTDIIKNLAGISHKYEQFEPIDVFFSAQILEKISDSFDIDLDYLGKTISNLQKIDKQVLLKSQLTNHSTDLILHHLDEILQNHRNEKFMLVQNDNFMSLLIDLHNTDFDGFALINNNSLQIEILNEFLSLDEVLQNEFFDSAVLLNSDLKPQLRNCSKIVVAVFASDNFFNSEKPFAKKVSTIFGILLPKGINYTAPISVFHKNENSENAKCSFWKYDKSKFGFWQNEANAKFKNTNISRCDYWHTTHFALLLVDADSLDLTTFDTLDLITTFNTGLSLFGLILIILTALFSKTWRSNTGNQILLNFVLILILQITAFFVSSTILRHFEHYMFCIIAGIILHYCTISQFCWMLIVAILQFRRFVDALSAPPNNVLVKSCICGWGIPLIPVISLSVLNIDSYVEKGGLCYPSYWGLYLAVWLPVSLIIFINTIIFVIIFYHIICRKIEITEFRKVETLYQLRLALLLFFMFGLTWIFGFLSNFLNYFIYLFTFTASLQGFVIFLYFVVFNANTRYLYSKALKKYFKNPKQ